MPATVDNHFRIPTADTMEDTSRSSDSESIGIVTPASTVIATPTSAKLGRWDIMNHALWQPGLSIGNDLGSVCSAPRSVSSGAEAEVDSRTVLGMAVGSANTGISPSLARVSVSDRNTGVSRPSDRNTRVAAAGDASEAVSPLSPLLRPLHLAYKAKTTVHTPTSSIEWSAQAGLAEWYLPRRDGLSRASAQLAKLDASISAHLKTYKANGLPVSSLMVCWQEAHVSLLTPYVEAQKQLVQSAGYLKLTHPPLFVGEYCVEYARIMRQAQLVKAGVVRVSCEVREAADVKYTAWLRGRRKASDSEVLPKLFYPALSQHTS